MRFARASTDDFDGGHGDRGSDREDAGACRRDGAGVLRRTAPAGAGGAGSDGIDVLVSAAAGGAGHRVSRGTSGGDSQGGDAQAETRPARRGVDPAVAGGEALSADLGADSRAKGSADVAATPAAVGAPAGDDAERAARAGSEPGIAARGQAVEPSRATGTEFVAVGRLQPHAARAVAAVARN